MKVESIARLFRWTTKRLLADFPDHPPSEKRRFHEACLGHARLLEQWHRTRARDVSATEVVAIVGVPVRRFYEWDRRVRERWLAPLSTWPRRKHETSVMWELEEETLAIRHALMTRTWGSLKIVAELPRRRGGSAPLSRTTTGRVVRNLKKRRRLPERAPGTKRRHR